LGVPPPEHSSDSEYDLIPLSQRLAFRRGEELASAVATKGVSVHERGAGWQPHGGGVEASVAEAAAGAELAWLQAGKNLLDFGGKVVEATGETGEAAMEAADMQTEASAGAGASSAVQADAAADGASAGASSSSAVPIDAAADGAAGSAAFADADASSAWRARAAATTATSRCCSATASSARGAAHLLLQPAARLGALWLMALRRLPAEAHAVVPRAAGAGTRGVES